MPGLDVLAAAIAAAPALVEVVILGSPYRPPDPLLAFLEAL
jgi:hypothetical protein